MFAGFFLLNPLTYKHFHEEIELIATVYHSVPAYIAYLCDFLLKDLIN